jgi:RNA polymerase sigma-70 factor (ECF subfamily)
MEDNPAEITRLLKLWLNGDQQAQERVYELLMPELRKIARRCFRGERPGHILQPTALVNEAFIRLANASHLEVQNRGHMLALYARLMRRCLIDRARPLQGLLFLPFDGLPERVLREHTPRELEIALQSLLAELELESRQRRAVVDLKYLGYTDDEAAEILHLDLRTLQREWQRARIWLYQRLSEPWKKVSNAAGS